MLVGVSEDYAQHPSQRRQMSATSRRRLWRACLAACALVCAVWIASLWCAPVVIFGGHLATVSGGQARWVSSTGWPSGVGWSGRLEWQGCSFGLPAVRLAGHRAVVSIPLWLLIIPPAATAALLGRGRRARPATGACGSCGYDPTGNLSGQCPECGTPLHRQRGVNQKNTKRNSGEERETVAPTST